MRPSKLVGSERKRDARLAKIIGAHIAANGRRGARDAVWPVAQMACLAHGGGVTVLALRINQLASLIRCADQRNRALHTRGAICPATGAHAARDGIESLAIFQLQPLSENLARLLEAIVNRPQRARAPKPRKGKVRAIQSL